jgi:hypothetical protein
VVEDAGGRWVLLSLMQNSRSTPSIGFVMMRRLDVRDFLGGWRGVVAQVGC